MAVYPTKKRSADGKPKWRLVQWVNGRKHETTVTGTKREATLRDHAWRGELERAPASPVRRQGPAVDLLSFSRGPYATHAMAHLARSTWEVRRFQLANVCRHLGALKLTEIDTSAVERYKGARTSEGAQPGTINTELAKLQAVLTYARDVGELCASPKVRPLPVRGRGRVKFWTREQIAGLFAAVERESPDLLPLVTFLVNTGCRKGEALACEKKWIDLSAGMIRIEPNEAWQPKDGEPREIPISGTLRPWLACALADAENTSRYVFTTTRRSKGREGRTRWAVFPRRRWETALRAAGLVDDLSEDSKGPHRLRHTFASVFLAGGASMFTLSRVLGHASIRTTEKCYAHLLPEHLEEARSVVNLGPNIGAAAHEARRRWGAK